MVSSLKEKNDSRESLLLASKEFLRVFTDATNHVPRHRRTQSVLVLYSSLYIDVPEKIFHTPGGRTRPGGVLKRCLHAHCGQGRQAAC
jgi:hypothetical protein